MMNSTAHSGPMFGGTLNITESGRQFLLALKGVIGRRVSIGANLHFNVLESTIIPPNCIVLQGDCETVYLIMDIQLNSPLKSILQTWQDTTKGTWKLITSGEQNAQHLMLRWPTLAENSGATG